MAKYFSSVSSVSIDSLEQEFKNKTLVKDHDKKNDSYLANVDTILVPFYEKDVLIKVPKDTKRNKTEKNEQGKFNRKQKKRAEQLTNYLVNKEKPKAKRTSYLELFRKQLAPQVVEKKGDNEIRSLSPEVGDSERDTFSEDINKQSNDFFNTECYNEIYYEQLLRKDFEQYSDYDIDVGIHLPDDISNKRDAADEDVFKSISEISHSRRRIRRITVQPIQNINLGGLGPDVEKIKPSLERARSLQRYSEKVRMENRLRIYKKTIEDEINKNNGREKSACLRISRRDAEDTKNRMKHEEEENISSYLVNKAVPDMTSNKVSKIYSSKAKSADYTKTKERQVDRDQRLKSSSTRKDYLINETKTKTNTVFGISKENKTRACDGNAKPKLNAKSKAINTDIQKIKTEAPVRINFLVNIGGLRPSTALRTLEEKHRVYQEKVKAFSLNCDK